MVIGSSDLGSTLGGLESSPLDLPLLQQLRIFATFFTYQSADSPSSRWPVLPLSPWKNQDQSGYTFHSVPIAPSRWTLTLIYWPTSGYPISLHCSHLLSRCLWGRYPLIFNSCVSSGAASLNTKKKYLIGCWMNKLIDTLRPSQRRADRVDAVPSAQGLGC